MLACGIWMLSGLMLSILALCCCAPLLPLCLLRPRSCLQWWWTPSSSQCPALNLGTVLTLLLPAPLCSGGGPHPVGEGQGGDRCVPLHQVCDSWQLAGWLGASFACLRSPAGDVSLLRQPPLWAHVLISPAGDVPLLRQPMFPAHAWHSPSAPLPPLPCVQPPDDDAGAGAAADNLQCGPPEQAVHPGGSMLRVPCIVLLEQAGGSSRGCSRVGTGQGRLLPSPLIHPARAGLLAACRSMCAAQALIQSLNQHCYCAPSLVSSHPPSRACCCLFCALQALIHGLNRHYYSLAINYRKTPLEERMLGNLQASAGCSVGCGGWAKHDAPAGQRGGANGECACWAVCRRVLRCLLLLLRPLVRHQAAKAAGQVLAAFLLTPHRLPRGLLQKHTWTKGLSLRNFDDHAKANAKLVEEIKELSSELGLAGAASATAAELAGAGRGCSRVNWAGTVAELAGAGLAVPGHARARAQLAESAALIHTDHLLVPWCLPPLQASTNRRWWRRRRSRWTAVWWPRQASHLLFARKAAPAFLALLITAGRCLKPCSLANVDTLPGQCSQQFAAGKMDAKKRLEGGVSQLMSANIVQCMGAMLDTVVF